MSYNNSQASDINTPNVSTGFIDFLANGEFDDMLSNTPRRMFYNHFLSQEEKMSVVEIIKDVKHVSVDCINQQQTNDRPNDIWGGEEADDICLEALERYTWGEDYAGDEKRLIEACIESGT